MRFRILSFALLLLPLPGAADPGILFDFDSCVQREINPSFTESGVTITTQGAAASSVVQCQFSGSSPLSHFCTSPGGCLRLSGFGTGGKTESGLLRFSSDVYAAEFSAAACDGLRVHDFVVEALDSAGNVLDVATKPSETCPRPWLFERLALTSSSPIGSLRLTGFTNSDGFDDLVIHLSIAVDTDIRPSSDSNPINLAAGGVVPVAILGSESFDVLEVDVTTLGFGPEAAPPVHEEGGHVEDVNGDGLLDLVSHYATRETGIAMGDTEATVRGELLGGSPFEGSDTIRTTIGRGAACGLGFELALVAPLLACLRRRRLLGA